eukprot:3058069-Pyramimonas_sp.AAC.1
MGATGDPWTGGSTPTGSLGVHHHRHHSSLWAHYACLTIDDVRAGWATFYTDDLARIFFAK